MPNKGKGYMSYGAKKKTKKSPKGKVRITRKKTYK